MVFFNLIKFFENRSVIIKDLEEVIKVINDSNYRYVIVDLLSDNKMVVVKIGMKIVVIDKLGVVMNFLDLLNEKVKMGIIGNIFVLEKLFEVFVNFSILI